MSLYQSRVIIVISQVEDTLVNHTCKRICEIEQKCNFNPLQYLNVTLINICRHTYSIINWCMRLNAHLIINAYMLVKIVLFCSYFKNAKNYSYFNFNWLFCVDRIIAGWLRGIHSWLFFFCFLFEKILCSTLMAKHNTSAKHFLGHDTI